MRLFMLKIFRITLSVAVLAGLCWLYWWVMPTLGLFRKALTNSPLPENGNVLILFQAGKIVSATALDMVQTGWPIAGQIWPFIVFGLLLGLAIGYPLGELARHNLAIDRASAAAIRRGEELQADASEQYRSAEKIWIKAQELEAQAREMKAELNFDREEILSMKRIAETELEAVQGWRHRIASLQKELTNARAKIRRLSKKSNKQPNKWN